MPTGNGYNNVPLATGDYLEAYASTLNQTVKYGKGAGKVLTDAADRLDQNSEDYYQKGISEWIFKWKQNGWRSSNRKPVKNKDLWVDLDDISSKFTIKWEWVKGHSGDPGNERADYLANKGCE